MHVYIILTNELQNMLADAVAKPSLSWCMHVAGEGGNKVCGVIS